MQLHSSSRGFTLLELSLVLVIIAVIVGSGLSVAIARLDIIAEKETRAKIKAIDDALMAFAKRNDRLPCPAAIALNAGDAAYGYESTPPLCLDAAVLVEKDRRAGAVPARTLNLPDEYMIDGWGNKITYAVNRVFTDSNATKTYTITSTTTNVITLCDTTALTTRSVVTMVIMSHGKNGLGAYGYGSTQPNAISSTADSANGWQAATDLGNNSTCLIDKEFYEGATTDQIFDDIIFSKTRAQIRTFDE